MALGGEVLKSNLGHRVSGNFDFTGSPKRRGQGLAEIFQVADRDLLAQPGSPAHGDHYLLPASGSLTGAAWSTFTNGNFAWFDNDDPAGAGWKQFAPANGMRVFVVDENLTLERRAGAWTEIPTKAYVDGLAVNLGKRQRVRAATTANITIATALNNGDTLDGVTLATGDLVLVKDQSAAAENGVYVVDAAPARAAEFDAYDEHPGSLIAVTEGSTNADTLWLCTSNGGGTLGSTAIAFARTAQDFNTAPLDVPGETKSPKRSLSQRHGDTMNPDNESGITMSHGTPATTTAAAWDAMATLANSSGKLVDGKGKLVRLAAGAGASVMPLQMREIRILGDLVNANTALPSRTALTILGMEAADIWAGGYASSALDSSASRGAWHIDLANNNIGVALGAALQLYENAQWGHTDFACKMSEVAYVAGFDLNTPSSGKVRVYLTGALQGNYTTGATARKFPAADLKWVGVTVTGKDDGIANQEGLQLVHFRSVELTDVEAIGCYDKGFGVYNCGQLTSGGTIKATRCNNPGLGYGLDRSGTSNVQIPSVVARDCKHPLTGGLGITHGILSRGHNIGLIDGDGGDALLDDHAGTTDLHVVSIMGRGRSQSGTEGDLVTFQGAGCRIDSIIAAGARRDGVLFQPYGDGDGIKRPMSLGYARLESASTVDGYAFQYDGTYANSQPPKAIDIGRLEAKWKRGVSIDVLNGALDSFSLGSGNIEGISNFSGVTIQCGSGGGLKAATLGKAGELRVKIPASVASIYPFDFQGISGALIDKASLGDVYADGGDYAIRANYCAVNYSIAELGRANQATAGAAGLSTLGTGGSITPREPIMESGSITPTIAGGSTAGVTTYTHQSGSYKRIGNVIEYELRVACSNQTGSGQILIGGLPQAAAARHGVEVWYANLNVGAGLELTPLIESGNSFIGLYSSYPGSGGASSVGMDTAFDIVLSGSYFI